ncbi:MAG: hypothetical protein ACTHMK_13890 [Dyella sp.]|uniref:hypothetical protein n=1 Tax=Dyella sp. TaxID=1869338 RepID=UPI003F7CFE19
MFQLESHQTKITSFTPRAEKHGDENVLAGTLKCETNMPSTVLDLIDKGMRKLLYRKPSPGEQSELPLGTDDGLTARRIPQLGPLKLDNDFPGYKLEIVTGLALNESLKLTDVEVHDFIFEALDGGTVKVRWSMNFHPDGQQSGKLCQLIQDTVEMTLVPPSADEQKERQEDLAA